MSEEIQNNPNVDRADKHEKQRAIKMKYHRNTPVY